MRANAAQRRQRLNQSRSLLQRSRSLADAVRRLVKIFSISQRQAYRYVKQAQALKEPVPVTSPKIAFMVKLPSAQVRQLRLYAAHTGLTLSDIVSRALSAMLDRGRRRG